ncbi:T9SS type A sorting domain-containing protein [candidate division WOR-3 bacterium]|nr:T9SS type A sorting domain-containing protein [candidate division WOR-3 bacterium]
MKKLYLLLAFFLMTGFVFAGTNGTVILPSNKTVSSLKGVTLQQLMSVSSRAGDDTIYYDDGNEAHHYYGAPYWGVRFTPVQPCSVKTALININTANNASCSVSIHPDNGGTPGTADETISFTAQEGWNAIDFSSIHFYTGDFWLTFNVPTTSSGPFVTSDDGGTGRSYYSSDGSSWTSFGGADWFIRAVGDYVHYDHDAKTISISPTGYVQPLVTITPTAVVKNNGLQDDSFSVICNIGTSYSDTVNLGVVTSMTVDTVTFETVTPDSGYVGEITVFTTLQGDSNTSNDTITGSFYAYWFPRQAVMLQNFTYTTCPYCPYQASAIHQLKGEEGNLFVPAEHHTWSTSDPFRIVQNDTIAGWYSVSGAPTSILDGVLTIVGGYTGVYDDIKSAYQQRQSIPSPVEITDTGNFVGSDSLQLVTNVINHGDIPSSWDLRLKYILRETDIPYSWETEDSIFWAVRAVQPNTGGVPFDGGTFTDTQNFTIDSSWDIHKCYIAIYVQDQNSKEIVQAKEVKVDDFLGIKTNNDDKIENDKVNIAFIKGKLKMNVGDKSNTRVVIYDLIGREVLNKKLSKGSNVINVNGKIHNNGVYFVRINDENNILGMKKIVLIK